MATAENPKGTSVKPSAPMPPWIGYVGVGMFVPGCLAAALGILSGDAKVGLSGSVLLSLGALSMANAYAGNVRADLLRRIDDLERRTEAPGVPNRAAP